MRTELKDAALPPEEQNSLYHVQVAEVLGKELSNSAPNVSRSEMEFFCMC